jgi:hypothetical protein
MKWCSRQIISVYPLLAGNKNHFHYSFTSIKASLPQFS